jgi:DnaJ-class molecular chaperone
MNASNEAKTHYSVLGIAKTATFDEIKKAYRKMAIIHHPDKGGTSKAFAEIGEAYNVLTNESSKRAYDMGGPMLSSFGGGGQSFGGSGNANEIFKQMFGGGSAFGSSHTTTSSTVQHPNNPYSSNIIENKIGITLEDACRGTTKRIGIGRKLINKSKLITCSSCGGMGQIQYIHQLGPIQMNRNTGCKECNETGFVGIKNAIELKKEVIELIIPPGAVPGMTFLFKNKGNEELGQSEPKHLVFILKYKSHLTFRHVEETFDLNLNLELSLIESLFGFNREIHHPRSSDPITICSGPTTTPTGQYIIRGLGLVWGEATSLVKGDLYLDVVVKYPEIIGMDILDEMKKMAEMVNPVIPVNQHIIEKVGNAAPTMSADIMTKYNEKVMQSIQHKKISECNTM